MSWKHAGPDADLQVYRLRASRSTKDALDHVASELKRRGLVRVASPTAAMSFAMHCAALALNIEPQGGRE
jgi:hypothetical protein